MTVYSGSLDVSGSISAGGHTATFSADLGATIESRVDSFGNGSLEETIKGTIRADVDGEWVTLPVDYTTPYVQISLGRYAISHSEDISYYGLDLNLDYALSGSFDANQTGISATGSINASGTYDGGSVSAAAEGSERLTANDIISVRSVTTPSTSGVLGIGNTVAIDVQLGSAVTVSGDAELRLSDGGIAHYDVFDSESSSGLLVFDYTVGKGQNSSNLKVLGVLLPRGASIDASHANGADLALSAADRALHLAVRGSPPKVAAVKATSSERGSEVFDGGVLTITLKMTEAVEVSGSPTLTLDDGGVATYDAGLSTAKSLAFIYEVGAETTKDLKIVGIDLSDGAAIVDAAGNALSAHLTSNLERSVNVSKAKPAVRQDDLVFDATSGFFCASALGDVGTGPAMGGGRALAVHRGAAVNIEIQDSMLWLGANASASTQTSDSFERTASGGEIFLGARH